MMKVLSVCAAVAAVLVGSAHAQEEAPEGEAAAAEEAVSDASASEAEAALERDLDLFWGERRAIEVVEKRLFGKDGDLEAAPYFGVIPNDNFVVYLPVGMRLGYHFSEQFSVEASYAYTFDLQSDLLDFLESEGIAGSGTTLLKQANIQEVISMYYNIDILWAPIYGKISLLGLKLTHFDTFMALGFGIFHTTEFSATNPEGNEVVKPSGNVGLGFRWHVLEWLSLRTEYRQFFFQKFEGGVSTPAELSLAIAFTPGF